MTGPEASFGPGDVVNTAYGVGVIVGQTAGFFSVRLWRIPGKSIGSSSLATLRKSCLLSLLPAAPGMATSLLSTSKRLFDDAEKVTESNKRQQVLVQCYYSDQNTFLVSPIKEEANPETEEDEQLILHSSRRLSSAAIVAVASEYLIVSPDELQKPLSAKFYPILETLIARGEEAAVATKKLLESESTKTFVGKTGKAIEETAGKLASNETAAADKFGELTASVEGVSVEDNVRQVISMVKDEQLTVLLENCKTRLEQLVSTDLSAASKQALEKTGIHFDADLTASSFSESVQASREAALSSLTDLLKQAELGVGDLDEVRAKVTANFTSAYDSLSTAAKSDRGLNDIFQTVAEKTTAWQEATGRVLQTRSAGLFLEGANRIKERAAALLGQGQFEWAGEIGSSLTKSFTEGDAALARLKSIELGEVVKERLVEAIEIRSESIGGLDGIIAGALSSAKAKSSESGNMLGNMLQTMQQNASKTTVDAHESLIAMLGSRSQYRDVALLRIESVLCNLESQIGEELSPEEIAAIAEGEGGTAKIFEPIARRAMKQIDKHLDSAESQVTDPTVAKVLKRVRKIMSGELSLSAITDEIVQVLNDDRVVAAGETIVQHSENVLDAFESVSGNKAVEDAIQIAAKAGVTKDSVMREIGKLDMNSLIGTAGDAVTDAKSRRKLLSKAVDTALDFILRVLPSMPVPPFEGVKDGLVYHIMDLSMKGFRVRKEDIQIELAGMRASKREQGPARKNSSDSQSLGDRELRSAASKDSMDCASTVDASMMDVEEIHASVKATELLIIDVKNISATLDNAAWSFEQTYLPYLKGKGTANVRMSGGAIRLQFELRKRRAANKDGDAVLWEPVLCLHDRSCSIAEVELDLVGEGRLTWILNKLVSIFKGILRDYVVKTIVRFLTEKSGWILSRLNAVLSPTWDIILRTAQLTMDDLVEVDEDVIVEEGPTEPTTVVELVWREQLPLGMNLLMNDESGLLKVVDFPRGSQARLVCERRGLNPDIFKGSSVLAVNGSEYDDQDDLFDALREPDRPKTIRFALAEAAESQRIKQFVEGASQVDVAVERKHELRVVPFTEPGELGIEFATALDGLGLTVKGFVQSDDGVVHAAERSEIQIGDLLTHINGELVLGSSSDGKDGWARALKRLEAAASERPLALTFTDPYLHRVVIDKPARKPGVDFEGGPDELVLEEERVSGSRRVAIKGFKDVSGMAESGGILIGDHLVFVNGLPVGAGCRWLGVEPAPTLPELHSMLDDVSSYPIGLTFARPRQQERRAWGSPGRQNLRDDQAETICITAAHRARIGCRFGLSSLDDPSDIVVKDLPAVPGVFQLALEHLFENDKIHVAIESVNGQFVPSYASTSIVRNALTRSYKSEDVLELVLCDDERREWVRALA